MPSACLLFKCKAKIVNALFSGCRVRFLMVDAQFEFLFYVIEKFTKSMLFVSYA